MRTLYWLFLTMILQGCIAVSSSQDQISNEQGDPVTTTTLTLNGFWDGQLDQAVTIRLLVWQGTVYGRDDNNGYYGKVSLNPDDESVILELTGRAISNTDDSADWYHAAGTNTTWDMTGLLFSAATDNDTMVGDYATAAAAGSFVVTNDSSWDRSSSISKLAGLWSAGDYELYISSAGRFAAIKGIAATTGGCTFEGSMAPVESGINLYSVTITERKNCDFFNETDIQGYATINNDGNLEFFLRSSLQLFFMSYSAG